jgi:hypothetical protein
MIPAIRTVDREPRSREEIKKLRKEVAARNASGATKAGRAA